MVALPWVILPNTRCRMPLHPCVPAPLAPSIPPPPASPCSPSAHPFCLPERPFSACPLILQDAQSCPSRHFYPRAPRDLCFPLVHLIPLVIACCTSFFLLLFFRFYFILRTLDCVDIPRALRVFMHRQQPTPRSTRRFPAATSSSSFSLLFGHLLPLCKQPAYWAAPCIWGSGHSMDFLLWTGGRFSSLFSSFT